MKSPAGTILVVDDDEDILTTARILLKRQGWEVRTERGPRNLPALLAAETFDVILLDMNFARSSGTGREGFEWLGKILAADHLAVVILITAFGDVEMAVRAIKEGAVDFVVKPWQNEKLIATISAAMELRKSHLEIDRLRSRQESLTADLGKEFGPFVGSSKPMRALFDSIRKVAATDANVLLLGENGTGKELAARELHRLSPRAAEAFISVDMGALSSTLFESELFGHVRGAFTDARDDRAGRFEIASGGTLFLDEISNLPLELQAKLMGVLQNRAVTRLGSNMARPVDIRLVCASNAPVRELVGKGRFREDLLYRINTVELHIPPLREREEDVPILVNHFLGLYSAKYGKPVKKLGAQTLKKLERYHWPGNVRELQHAVERAVILSESETLQPVDFYFNPAERTESITLKDFRLGEVERNVILKAIAKHRGNISQAAKELGLTRAALYRRLGKYGL
jgi:DNA-binding NtrC family response regulator